MAIVAKRVAADPQRKAEALRLESEHGAAEASRRTGVPAGTIRAWKARGEGARTSDLAEVSGDQLRSRVRELEKTADLGIRQLQETMRHGSRSPQSLAISVGVCLDKAAQLASAMRELEDREARLAEGEAQTIDAILRLALQALGIPIDPLRPVMRELLPQAMSGGPYVVSPAVAEPAYAAIRAHFERIVRRDLEAERKMLPAPEPDGPEEAGVDGVVVDEADCGPASDDEPVDAEVVEPEYTDQVPHDYLHAYGDEKRARAAWEAYKANRAECEEREAQPEDNFGVGRHTSRAGGFDMQIPGGF